MENNILKAMEELSGLNESHGINVKGGKKYTQVVHRVEVFRKHFGLEYGVDTQISNFADGVLCKAYITKGEAVIGSGHAYATKISGEKNLEKLETTALGRALASVGLSGGEYASDMEMDTWQERYEPKKNGKINALNKTGVREIDRDAMDKAMTEIQNAIDAEAALELGRHHYARMKKLGATEEQLDLIQTQTESRKAYLEGVAA